MASKWLRRYAPVLLIVAAALWIVAIVVWITVSPVVGSGNPMD